MNTPLKVDPEFEKVCLPLTDDEFELLRANIIEEGIVYMPLIVWEGFIVDGHHRHKVIRENPTIEFSVRERHFENRYEVISWICKNQLGRRNLNELQRAALIGRRYDAEKLAHGGNSDRIRDEDGKFTSSGQIGRLRDSRDTTAKRLAEEMGVSPNTVKRDGLFVKGLNAAEEVTLGIEKQIMSGELTPTKSEIIAIAKAPPEARRQMAEDLRLTPEEKKSRKEQREVLKNIEAISAELARPKEKNDVDNVLGIIGGAADSFKKTCIFYISEFPELLSEDKPRLIKTIDGLKQYVNYLYEGEQT